MLLHAGVNAFTCAGKGLVNVISWFLVDIFGGDSDNHYPLCVVAYFKPIVRSFSYQPGNSFSATQHPLFLLVTQGELPVRQIVAYTLFADHSKRNKHITLFPFSYTPCCIHLVCIKASCFFIFGNYKFRSIIIYFRNQTERWLGFFLLYIFFN